MIPHVTADGPYFPLARPVASAGLTIDHWTAAELAERAHEHLIRQAAIVQVFDQRAEGLIVLWQALA